MARTYLSSARTEEIILSLSGNKTLLLDSPAIAWLVQEGKADVYAVTIEGGLPKGRLIHLYRAEMGQTLFGIKALEEVSFGIEEVAATGEKGSMGLIVTGIPGTTLIRRKRKDLLEKAREKGNLMLAEPAAYLVESWVLGLSAGIIARVPPTRFKIISQGDRLKMDPGDVFRPKEDILWVRHRRGSSQLASRDEMTLHPGEVYHPLIGDSWLQSVEAGDLECSATLDLINLNREDEETELWQALDFFHANALNCISQNYLSLEEKEREWMITGVQSDKEYLHRAFKYLERAVKLEDKIDERFSDPMEEVCRKVGLALKMTMKEPPQWVKEKAQDPVDYLRDIAQASNVRYRAVSLKGTWWKKDHGPLVAFKDDGSPLAILPGKRSFYCIYDPITGKEERLDAEQAKGISPLAYMLYRPFSEGTLTSKGLLKDAFSAIWKQDLVLAILMGLSGGLLGLLLPYLTGILFDGIIPTADRSQLIFLLQFLLVSALVIFFFQVVRSIAILRTTTRIDANVQAAIWDRLLKLPLSFFQQFSAGDLGNRSMSLNIVLQLISGMVSNTFFTGLFSLTNFILIFYYSPPLAFVALLLVFIAVAFSLFIGNKQYCLQKDVYEIEGTITGLLLQVFGGISRFRMAGAENRAYFLWAREFGKQRQISYQAQLFGNVLLTFSSIYPLLASIIIFFSLFNFYGGVGEGMSTGIFLAFNAAFTGMLVALMALSNQMVVIMNALPLLKRFQPIVEAKPEVDEHKMDPGELRGHIEVSGVSFRYYPEDPLILNDISFTIKPGQMVAIVGSSGSGKSTLFKILLGFLNPEKGTIYLDGQDLSNLDYRYVRGQLGVVLQNDKLSPGSIMDNILGASGLSINEAWEAARLAGIEGDIKEMPMGMHTFIAEGAATVSGGQRQRLLIARAIVRKPRIIMFDEATSALDNRTQKIVKESLDELKSTRLVIAHRLTTIMNADLIIVLDKGKVVQRGTYHELISEKGLFQDMATRQIV